MAEKNPDAAEQTMVSVVQFAALVELTVQRVYQLCQQSILPRIVDGNLPVIAGMQAYIRYLRGFSNADAQSRTSFAQERARLFKARADIAELERQTRFDRLVPIEDIEASWVQLVGNFRTRITAIPSKAETRVVGVKTIAKGQATLRHLAECVVFLLEKLQTPRLGRQKPIVLPLPVEAGRQANSCLPAAIRHGYAFGVLLENERFVSVGKPRGFYCLPLLPAEAVLSRKTLGV